MQGYTGDSYVVPVTPHPEYLPAVQVMGAYEVAPMPAMAVNPSNSDSSSFQSLFMEFKPVEGNPRNYVVNVFIAFCCVMQFIFGVVGALMGVVGAVIFFVPSLFCNANGGAGAYDENCTGRFKDWLALSGKCVYGGFILGTFNPLSTD